jgi:poly-gamma-glutamate system protein
MTTNPVGLARKKPEAAVYVLCALSLLAFALVRVFALKPLEIKKEMLSASALMKKATETARLCRETKDIPINRRDDCNLTGLIGLESSVLTTSLGNLEAKRTTTNPNFAGLIVSLLNEAGVKRGDTIAIGASSSFPALIVASLCAAKTMELKTLLICSLGASQWGANDPGFHWLDIHQCLLRAGIVEVEPVALSLGGDGDVGRDMSPEGRSLLREAAQKSGVRFLDEPDLARNVADRLKLFGADSGSSEPKAFVNIGGGYANMGTDSEILHVRPGLASFRRLPVPEKRGVIFEMAARRIPVIHLLYIKGIAERYGLPWDPRPLPQPGEGDIYNRKALARLPFFIIAGVYFALLVLFAWRLSPYHNRLDALVGL